MRQPEPTRDSKAFLSALADQLSSPPDELTTGRHVRAAASLARSARAPRTGHVVRWAVAALTLTTVVGTGGIAVAGGLPGPMQVVVADMARALPVPFHIPYPTVGSHGVTEAESVDVDRRPEDAETQGDEHESVGVEEDGSKAPAVSPGSDRDDESEVELDPLHESKDRGVCGRWGGEDLSDLSTEEAETVRDRIREECDPDFVGPPRFARGHGLDDPDRGRSEDHRDHGSGSDDDQNDDDRDERDRDRSGRGGRDDTDAGSSDSEDSEDNSRDEEEERDEDDGDDEDDEHDEHDEHDKDDDQDRSSNDGWRGRHD